MRKLTVSEIAAAKSAKGGFTKAQLQALGIAWPPAKGWTKREFTEDQIAKFIQLRP